MPESATTSNAILETLGFAVFVRDASGTLRLQAEPPPWLRELWPGASRAGAELPLAEISPFLDNFLIDAETCWRNGDARCATSGPWVETDTHGRDIPLAATALTAGSQAILLVERLGEAFALETRRLQTARDNVIAFQRLNAEMQKKDILLHCVAEDLSAALGNIITALRLIEVEQNPTIARQLLALAARATQDQQSLINKVLGTFAHELESLYGRTGLAAAEAELFAVARRAIELAAPQFAEKGVRLDGASAPADEVRIPAHTDYLERVISNLLENALHRAPAGGEVALRLEDQGETVLVRVEDSGPELPPDLAEKLFKKFDAAGTASPALKMRLHFCRIAVENCNGEIGYTPRTTGGNCFWIRLPKVFHAR